MWHCVKTPIRAGGYQEFTGALHYQRYGLTDTGVRTRRFEGSNTRLGPSVDEDPFVGFSGVQDGLEGP